MAAELEAFKAQMIEQIENLRQQLAGPTSSGGSGEPGCLPLLWRRMPSTGGPAAFGLINNAIPIGWLHDACAWQVQQIFHAPPLPLLSSSAACWQAASRAA